MRARAAWLAGLVCLASGCAPDLYLSESDVAAFTANAATSQAANGAFADLAGERLDVRFQHAGGSVSVRSSNTAAFLRTIATLALLESLWEQVDLGRLAEQLDDQLAAWMEEQIATVPRLTDSNARIARLDRAWLDVLEAPTLEYDAAQQVIRYQTRLRAELKGRLWVDGDYFNAGLALDSITLRGEVRLRNLSPHAARVEFRIDPELGAWRVTGISSDSIRDAVRDFLGHLITAPRREFHVLEFDQFAIPYLALEARAGGGGELIARYDDKAPNATPHLDVVSRDEAGAVFHLRGAPGAFSEARQVPLTKPVASDVALVASAPGELDLVAVAADGELLHSHFNGLVWSALRPTSPLRLVVHRYRTDQRPALVATGPAALEVVAVGQDGRLRHARLRNGAWEAPAAIPDLQRPTGDVHREPVALQITQKLLVAFRDADSAVRGVAFDLETGRWAQSFSIEENVAEAPTLASLGDGTAYLAVVGSDRRVRGRKLFVTHLWFTPTLATTGVSMGPSEDLGSRLRGPATLVTSGDGQLELLGRGMDRRLSHRRQTSGPAGWVHGRTLSAGWQAWEHASGRFFGTPGTGLIMPDIAAASTRDGELHAVARVRSSGASRVLHNLYPGWRFGRGPWRSVHWRGLDRIADRPFVGRPSIAISDRSLALTLVDSWQRLWDASVGDGGAYGFRESWAGLGVRDPGDPAVISAGPGHVALFATSAADGQLRHIKRRGGATNVLQPEAAPVPVVSSLAVAPGGDGDLDLAATTQAGELSHWRYRKGEWWIRYPVATGVLSSPAIVRTGSGQLELFAIGSSQQLRRWRYRDGGWSEGPSFPSPSSVSATLFGAGCATTSGAGRVDVVIAADGTGQLFHTRFSPGPEAPTNPLTGGNAAAFQALGVATADVPILTALAEGRLHLLVPASGGRTLSSFTEAYRVRVTPRPPGGPLERARPLALDPQTELTATRWRPFESILPANLHVASVARLGANELALVASSRNRELFLARYRDWRWLGAAPLGGSYPPLPLGRPVRVFATAH